MKLLMLRAQITNDNEQYMCHKKVEEEDDWYVLLINQLLLDGHIDEAEIWYYGLERKPITYSSGLRLKYDSFKGDFEPDIIFARGGFEEYVPVLDRFRNAIRVYYGAGARFLPRDGLIYDHVLVDSEKRMDDVKFHFPDSKVHLFKKGCADHLFKYKQTDKKYDIGNVTSIATNKGQDTIGKALEGTGFKLINIGQYTGNTVKKYRQWGLNATFTGRLHRKEVAQYMRQCKYIFVGDHWRAGCPRVIPECMSLGIFVVMLDDIPITEYYSQNLFTIITNKNKLKKTLINLERFSYNSRKIHDYYTDNFDLSQCAMHIAGQILTKSPKMVGKNCQNRGQII